MFHIESMEWVKKGVGRPKHIHPHAPEEKHFKMKEMYIHGNTLEEIGKVFNISRERVRQLLNKHFGMTYLSGGANVRSFVTETYNQKLKIENRKTRIANSLGCTIEYFYFVNTHKTMWAKGSPSRAYLEQKRNAIKHRNIPFTMNFKEWFEVWEKSGKWELRGRGAGYCMTRIGDTGGYEIGNVEIKTISENFKESFIKHPQEQRHKKAIENGKHPAAGVKKDICKRGHLLSGYNLYISPKGARGCKECRKAASNKATTNGRTK